VFGTKVISLCKRYILGDFMQTFLYAGICFIPTVIIMHSALDRHCPHLVSVTRSSKIQIISNVSISDTSFMLCTHLDMKCWDRLG
jgi:hypothetical protein